MVIWHLKQIGKVKEFDKWVPHLLTVNLKYYHLKCRLLLFYTTTNHFWSDCDVWQKVDFIRLRSSKALPKAKLAPKKVMVTGGLLPFWSIITFWILVEPLYLRRMLSRLMRCTENCNAYSQHWRTGLIEWAQFFSTTTPDCMSENQLLKSWANLVMKFCLIHHIHLTSRKATTTSSSISTLFAGKTLT